MYLKYYLKYMYFKILPITDDLVQQFLPNRGLTAFWGLRALNCEEVQLTSLPLPHRLRCL